MGWFEVLVKTIPKRVPDFGEFFLEIEVRVDGWFPADGDCIIKSPSS